MPMSFYWMNLPIEGTLYPEGSVLSGHSLAQYERQIQYMLHNVVSTKEMQDNGRLLLSLPEGKLKERILTADLSVMAEKGELLGRLELETVLPLLPVELSDLQAYLQQQFSKGWGNWFQQKPIFNEQKTLLIRFPPPKVYHLSEQKYEITAISHPKFPWLHRIRALVQVNEDVSRGSLGGYVESLQNLSQEGHCWIYDDAIACEDSQVIQDGRLFDGAIAGDSALVSALHDKRTCSPQLLFEQARRCAQGRPAQRIGADQLSKLPGVVGRRGVIRPHFNQCDVDAPLRELPRRLAAGQPRPDDDGLIHRSRPPLPSFCGQLSF